MNGNFKLIIIIFFIACAVLGIMVFAGIIPIGGTSKTPPLTGSVVMWGTAPSKVISPLTENYNEFNRNLTVSYVQKSPDTYDHDLVEAFASGHGPDLFLLPDNLANKYSNKIFTIPYTTFPLVNFKNYYASSAEVFLNDQGTLAFPLSVDPLLLYYNRGDLDANNVVYPPTTWDEFKDVSGLITKKDSANHIIKTSTALGQYSNVNNAKDILATFFMQLGNPITSLQNGKLVSNLLNNGDSEILSNALLFYTSFSNPVSPTYSWNRTFPKSQDLFSSDKLTFYLGFASEFPTLVLKNPNQNLGITQIPQIKNSNTKATMGHVTGIAISSSTKSFDVAYAIANALAGGDFAKRYADAVGIAPVRRDLLAQKQDGIYLPVLYSSALISKSWLDPSPTETNSIFSYMIESILTNDVKPKDAILDAGTRINSLLK